MYLDTLAGAPGGSAPHPSQRSSRAEVRNPVLGLPCARRVHDMPAPARDWLIAFLGDLRTEARERAEKAWKTNKPGPALYWRVTSIWCSHLCRVLRKAARSSGV